MGELRMTAQDRRRAGRRRHFDGRERTVLYTDMAARLTLPTAGLDPVLEALRAGTIILQTEPTTIAAQGPPRYRGVLPCYAHICDYNALLLSVTGLLRMSGYCVFQPTTHGPPASCAASSRTSGC